ncbi:hypothetical protein HYQ46_004903 [Verticillium longisporum]|nr:hypothetical protein HYQ46_004903 [Verticillium longisporum]
MDDGNGLGLAALGQEEFGRLKEVEQEAADTKHDQSHDANNENEQTPTLIGGPVGNAVPGDERGYELADRPPYGEQSQQRARCVGKKLEKEGTVDREIAADAEAKGGKEKAGYS